eukprot:1143800-Pelagomonas_calceolata.AAC.1
MQETNKKSTPPPSFTGASSSSSSSGGQLHAAQPALDMQHSPFEVAAENIDHGAGKYEILRSGGRKIMGKSQLGHVDKFGHKPQVESVARDPIFVCSDLSNSRYVTGSHKAFPGEVPFLEQQAGRVRGMHAPNSSVERKRVVYARIDWQGNSICVVSMVRTAQVGCSTPSRCKWGGHAFQDIHNRIPSPH